MEKFEFEINIQKLIEDKVEKELMYFCGKSKNDWISPSQYTETLLNKLISVFIDRYANEIFEKIDREDLAKMLVQKSSLVMAKNFAGIY